MVIDFQSTNFKADQKLLDFISAKLSKLDRYYNRITNATVYLKVENTADKINKTLEIKINLRENQLFTTEHDRTFEAATDKAMEALKHQLDKIKTKAASA
ncbi:MAG: ribosome-associated translation inhibitor RaiA [Bacteroidetes bacterium]|nr:ribosome-associated translation inhibitor RaiA [Bacteroidota bacterium]